MVLSKSFQLEKIVQGKDTKGMAVPMKPESLKISAWKRMGAIAIGTKSSVSSSNMWGGTGFPPHVQAILGHQPGDLQFNSIPTLSIWK